MRIQSNKTILSLAGIAGIFLVIFLVLMLASLFSTVKKSPTNLTASPTPVPPVLTPTIDPFITNNPQQIESSQTYKQSFQEINNKYKESLRRDALVGQLLKLLPYQGRYFLLTYSYDANRFTATIDATNKTLGNQEFDQFLKQNNILDRSWIINLQVVYQ